MPAELLKFSRVHVPLQLHLFVEPRPTRIAKGSLNAKAVLVTHGASRGVGAAMALYLGDED